MRLRSLMQLWTIDPDNWIRTYRMFCLSTLPWAWIGSGGYGGKSTNARLTPYNTRVDVSLSFSST